MNKLTPTLSREAFLSLFDESVHEALVGLTDRYPDATHVVCFECLDMSSSHLGKRTAMAVGPSNTYGTLDEVEGKHLGDLPSTRLYAVSAVTAADLKGNH